MWWHGLRIGLGLLLAVAMIILDTTGIGLPLAAVIIWLLMKRSPDAREQDSKEAHQRGALLFGQPDFPDCYFGKRHGIGNAALVNVDHSPSDDLANRIVTIHQVEFPDGAIERQFENVPLLWRKIALVEQARDRHDVPPVYRRKRDWSPCHR
jgi:hypothetical protein